MCLLKKHIDIIAGKPKITVPAFVNEILRTDIFDEVFSEYTHFI